MFTLDLSHTYRANVTVYIRDAEGAQQPHTFQADFLRMGPEAFRDYMAQVSANGLDDRAVAAHVLQGWHGIADDQGQPVAYSEGTKTALLGGVTGAATAIARVWHESVMDDVRKNLLPPPSDGPAAPLTLVE